MYKYAPQIISAMFKTWHNAVPTNFRMHAPARRCIFGCRAHPQSDAGPPPDRLIHYLVCPTVRPKIYSLLEIETGNNVWKALCLEHSEHKNLHIIANAIFVDLYQRVRINDFVSDIESLIKDSYKRIRMTQNVGSSSEPAEESAPAPDIIPPDYNAIAEQAFATGISRSVSFGGLS